MKQSEIKKDVCVKDRWWPEWGIGKIIKKLKTRCYIQFSTAYSNNGKILIYDKDHYQFLQKVKLK
jgi:hypothetical protein